METTLLIMAAGIGNCDLSKKCMDKDVLGITDEGK